MKFYVDWLKGQKTGFFVDQRENRALLERYSRDRTVLNMFCYTGGFSFAAMRGGARLVHSVDSSSKAIDLTNKNVELNFPGDERHKAFAEDAFKFLEQMGDRYNLIVLDPPAFAKHKKVLHNALQGYRKLNGDDAMQVIRWRKNDSNSPYGNPQIGDSGRMQIQQDFLKAVIKQLLQLENVPNLGKLAEVFQENVETDLSFENILWFGKRAFSGGLSMDDVNFMTMPYKGAAAYSRVYSKQLGKDFYLEYVVPIPGKLLDIVNNQLSPFKEVFTLSDLDIMSVNADGSISSTTGHVEDSKAAVPPTLMGSGKKDEPEKDYITDENGNLIDPDTGEIVSPPEETEPGTETPSETPSEPTPETPATPETPGTGTETTDPSGSTGGETGTGSPETPDQPEDPGIIVVPPEEPATPDANQGLDPATGEPLPMGG